jgi:hypothetical protein
VKCTAVIYVDDLMSTLFKSTSCTCEQAVQVDDLLLCVCTMYSSIAWTVVVDIDNCCALYSYVVHFIKHICVSLISQARALRNTLR